MGYDSNDKIYTYDSFNALGQADHAKGNVEPQPSVRQRHDYATSIAASCIVSTRNTCSSTGMSGKDARSSARFALMQFAFK